MDFSSLREAYSEFVFENFTSETRGTTLHVQYCFSIPGLASFCPAWDFPNTEEVPECMLFSLGMVELVSYWKCTCAPVVTVKCGSLTPQQIRWWKKLYYNGLGEFFHVNGIKTDENAFMSINSSGTQYQHAGARPLLGCLVPIGGGKDSAVTLEILKSAGMNIASYTVNPRKATVDTCAAAGVSEQYAPHRTLDRRIIELNAQGFLNGHTPFSAILAFSALITAYTTGKKYIVLSNESSANEPTSSDGANHQYSKSFEFEQDFRNYENEYIASGCDYFSLLRPLSEYQIAKLFASYTQYHSIFRSCNAASKLNAWCGHCPKCLFVAVILAPFLGCEATGRIFGGDINILDDESLIMLLDKLIGLEEDKPFECVGSRDEAIFALNRLSQRCGDDAPALVRYFRTTKLYKSPVPDFNAYFDACHNVPFTLLCTLAAALFGFEDYIKTVFANKSVAVLGYGREGRSTAALFDSLGIAYTVIDEKQTEAPGIYGEGCQDALDGFDVVVKSPGVVLKKQPEDHKCVFTSQCELFITKYRMNVIGVTGTKGKSTTSSLIYHALDFCGTDCVYAGNIGVPPFDIYKSMSDKTVAVLELSSHQLEYISVSPHTAVYLNLHEEHLDHYGSFEKYRHAKENIYRFMMPGDLLVCGTELKPEHTPAQIVTVGFGNGDVQVTDGAIKKGADALSIKPEDANLAGIHGLFDIACALEVCSHCIKTDCFLHSLPSFRPLPHRLEYIGMYDGIKYYDDSISTIGDTVINALNALPDTDTVLIGGMDRGISYDDLTQYLEASAVKHILLMETSGKRIYNNIMNGKDDALKSRTEYTPTLKDAVARAKQLTRKEKICLLSPAAASYGIFKSFEERGNAFAALVKDNEGKNG
ncbi:MAG TPA: UDP-N-acetylmuramoyl-L-alanine--D-glutamate ligase [Bacillota bacterium]|nr:UDP-N-acetylmuramoyl-L-alanine--D-glutamate ligase [Bacillota bacterium]